MKTIEELYKEITENEELKKEFEQAQKDLKVPEFLKEHGCEVTEESISAFLANQSGRELTDDELDNASGGGCGGSSSSDSSDVKRCMYCGQPITDGKEKNGMHQRCYDEWNRKKGQPSSIMPPIR